MRRPADSASELGDAQIVPLDLRDAESVCACVQEMLNREGRIDVLVNNLAAH